jgi:hypothetical protein
MTSHVADRLPDEFADMTPTFPRIGVSGHAGAGSSRSVALLIGYTAQQVAHAQEVKKAFDAGEL